MVEVGGGVVEVSMVEVGGLVEVAMIEAEGWLNLQWLRSRPPFSDQSNVVRRN